MRTAEIPQFSTGIQTLALANACQNHALLASSGNKIIANVNLCATRRLQLSTLSAKHSLLRSFVGLATPTILSLANATKFVLRGQQLPVLFSILPIGQTETQLQLRARSSTLDSLTTRVLAHVPAQSQFQIQNATAVGTLP